MNKWGTIEMSPTVSPRTNSMVINTAINHSLGLTLPLIFPIAQLTLFTVKQSQDQSMFYLELVAIQKLNKVVQELVMRIMVRTFWQWGTVKLCLIGDLRDFSERLERLEGNIPECCSLWVSREVILVLFIFLIFAKVTVLKFWKFKNKNAIKYNYIDIYSYLLLYRLCWWISSSQWPKGGMLALALVSLSRDCVTVNVTVNLWWIVMGAGDTTPSPSYITRSKNMF